MKTMLLLTVLALPLPAHAEIACSITHDEAGEMYTLCTRPVAPLYSKTMVQTSCCPGDMLQKTCISVIYDASQETEPASCNDVMALRAKRSN